MVESRGGIAVKQKGGSVHITQSQNNTPQLSLTIKAPLQQVWHALRDKDVLLQWHGWDTPNLKDEIENIYFTDIKEQTDNEQKHSLVVNGGDAFMLETDGVSTKLTLVRAGLSGDPQWDAYYDNITEGWVSFIEQLRFLLERSPNLPRTATFEGKVLDRHHVAEQLQLTQETEGAQFFGQFQGEDLSGEIWFSTPNQLGLVINQWGPGLLIIQFSEKGCIATKYK